MLEQARDPQFGMAWMREGKTWRVLRAQRWTPECEPNRLSFFAPDFALSQTTPWLVGEPIPWTLEAEPLPAVTHRMEPSSGEFAALHEEILKHIAEGEFSKVVPIVCEELEFTAPLRAEMFSGLAAREFPHQYFYGFDFAGEGECGVTPELLFRVRDGVLETMALAGTGRADGPSLLDDRKERHEHQVVIDHIVQELAPIGPAEVLATTERVFGILKHLYTPIRVRLARQVSFLEIVVKLHPTAALGGWPRRPAVEWLERQRFHVGRRRFGAPFGYQDGDEMACVVAIRGLQWWGTRALLSAGCGVVAGSEALREWRELQLKREATRRMLGLEL